MEYYINDCIWNFCVINRYVNKYFNCFPLEVINAINYHYITIYGHINKLPFTCDKPGKYWITKDWEFHDDASIINIIADNVHIDLQGHTITNHNSYETIYIKDVVNGYIDNGVLSSSINIHIINSRIRIEDLTLLLVDNRGLTGDIGDCGDRGNCDKIKPISSRTHKYYNNHLYKNIPKNVKRCKRNKY